MPIQGPQQSAAPASPSDERIWVQGEAAAQAYLVAANGFVRLWDSTAPVFYEKRTDPTGRPFELEVYEYKRRGEDTSKKQAEPSGGLDYGAQIDALKRRVVALEQHFQRETVEETDYD